MGNSPLWLETMEYVINAENLTAGYDKNPALNQCSLRILPGALVGFCGPNGAGKSSFLKACLGILKIRGGSVSVLGMRPGSRGFSKTLRHIGYVPQNTAGGSLPATVREAVSMGRYGIAGFFRRLSRQDRVLVEEAMEAAGVAGLAGRLVQNLSGGQAQRVAIARALAMEARLLLLDEPTASLDREGQIGLLDIIRARHKTVTAVVVSHSAETLAGCTEIYRFENGWAEPFTNGPILEEKEDPQNA